MAEKLIVVLFVFCITTSCICNLQSDPSKVLHYDFDLYSNGRYKYSLYSSHGFDHNITGVLEELVPDGPQAFNGWFQYTTFTRERYNVQYIAGNNGLQLTVLRISDIGDFISGGAGGGLGGGIGADCASSLCGTGLG